MRIFLTGGSGFIGAATLRLALQAGHTVAVPVRPGSSAHRLEPMEGKYERISLDLLDSSAVIAAMSNFEPDVIIHSAWAGVTDAAQSNIGQVKDNMEIALLLTEAAIKVRAKAFVGIGSQAEYGLDNMMNEDDLPRPTSTYGAAKVAALFLTRQLAMQAGIRHCWLRVFATYGPDDNPNWLIPMLIKKMLDGVRPRITLGTQNWDWLHVTDVARAVIAVAESSSAKGVFNLGSGQPVSVRSVIERIRDLAAPDLKLVFGEIPFHPNQIMHMRADISRLQTSVGWIPTVCIGAGLVETVNWYRMNRR